MTDETTIVTPAAMMMQMLADHVPVSLLLDLMAPPDAHELFTAEGGDADWLATLTRSAA